MKLLIHAGIHRTGTTTLQRFLAGNRKALAARGVVYPGKEKSHQKLAWSLTRGDAGAEDVLALAEVAAEAETVVLSGEDFSIQTDLRWLAEVARHHDVRAVFYLRRQDHWVMSWYNQHVKWPFNRAKSQMDPQAFLATLDDYHWLDYEKLLGRWCAVLGEDRVAVAVIGPGQVQDVVPDFLGRLAVSPAYLAVQPPLNDSLPVHMLEVARNLGLFDLPSQQRVRLLKALREGLADKDAAARTVYSPAERLGILASFAQPNRAVAERYFDREDLFLEPPPQPDAPYFRFPDLPREALMRDWVAPVIGQFLRPQA